jgi:hypothetical protein
MGPKTLPTIWGTYMKLVTKYQISAINSYWEKCDEKYIGRTDRGKTAYPPPPSASGGIKFFKMKLTRESWSGDHRYPHIPNFKRGYGTSQCVKVWKDLVEPHLKYHSET